MRIEIRLCTSLARVHPAGGACALDLPPQATLADALARIGLRPKRLSTVLCNGESAFDADGHLEGERPLRDGDHLVVGSTDPAARRSFRLARLNPVRHLSALLSPLIQTR